MKLYMKDLENCFETAMKLSYTYVGVKIDIVGFEKPEIVINSKENFEDKLDYFKKAYDENLMLVNNPNIRIIGFAAADTFEDLEELLYE